MPCAMVSFKDSACLPWSSREKRGGRESGESMNKAAVRVVLSMHPAMKRRVHTEE